MVIYLPPFSSSAEDSLEKPPSFLDRFPTASIHYRWSETLEDINVTPTPTKTHETGESNGDAPPWLHWPTPIHDTLFGYEWIINNLPPSNTQRRDIYVYGTFLGASLGAALALTESHAHQRMAVRGLLAFNGIYNWTTFLPDHPVNKAKTQGILDTPQREVAGTTFHFMKQQIPGLFKSPTNLFDPFASPVLFFHTAGLLVPGSFTDSTVPSSLLRAIDALSGSDTAHAEEEPTVETAFKAPRKGYLAFPPRQSSLKIPESLLLHETPPPLSTGGLRVGRRRRSLRAAAAAKGEKSGVNSFRAQAEELAGMMRRSVNKLELKERMKWDEDFDDWDHEAERRVRTADVGRSEGAGFDLSEHGQELAVSWLEERMAG